MVGCGKELKVFEIDSSREVYSLKILQNTDKKKFEAFKGVAWNQGLIAAIVSDFVLLIDPEVYAIDLSCWSSKEKVDSPSEMKLSAEN